MAPTATVTVTPLDAQLVADGKDVAHGVLTSFKDFVDASLTGVEAKVAPIATDGVSFAESFLETHAGPGAQTYLQAAFGLGAGLISTATTNVDAAVVAQLHDLNATLDSKLEALGGSVAPAAASGSSAEGAKSAP